MCYCSAENTSCRNSQGVYCEVLKDSKKKIRKILIFYISQSYIEL